MSIKPLAMRDIFLERIWQTMATDEKIFFVSADFGSPVLDKIRADFPKRFTNVGIAEQNLINISAGLALEGYTVFAYAIAPFITMRCFEQIRVSLALLSEVRPMNVNLIGVGAGFSYVVSGPTHQCYEDLTLMRGLPNFEVLSPSDHISAGALFDRCLKRVGPKYLRFDAQVLPVLYDGMSIEIQKGFHVLREGKKVCLIATGYTVHTALAVAQTLKQEGIELAVVDLFDLARYDAKSLLETLSNYDAYISLEEGFHGRGGLDAMLFNFLSEADIASPYLNLGVKGGYRFELGSRQELHEQVGIGPVVVADQIRRFLASKGI
jgi:transketolase